jgi:hypothetical protein
MGKPVPICPKPKAPYIKFTPENIELTTQAPYNDDEDFSIIIIPNIFISTTTTTTTTAVPITTTTTTTTTYSGNTGICTFEYYSDGGGGWDIIESNCSIGFTCANPPTRSGYTGERVTLFCV